MKSEQNFHVETQNKDLSLIGFPSEILFHIFSYLASPRDLVALSKSNKTLRNIAFDCRLWKPFEKDRFIYSKKVILTEPLTSQVQVILPNGYMISGNEDGDFDCRVWDLESGKCIEKLHGHNAKITALACLRDFLIASGDANGIIRVWDVTSWKCTDVMKVGFKTKIDHIVFLQHSKIICGDDYGTIMLWELSGSDKKSGQFIKIKNAPIKYRSVAQILAMIALPNDNIAICYNDETSFVGSGKFDIYMFDVSNWEFIMKLEGHEDFVKVLQETLGDGNYVSSNDEWDEDNFFDSYIPKEFWLGANSLTILPRENIIINTRNMGLHTKCWIWDGSSSEVINTLFFRVKLLKLSSQLDGRLVIVIEKSNNRIILTYPSSMPECFLNNEVIGETSTIDAYKNPKFGNF